MPTDLSKSKIFILLYCILLSCGFDHETNTTKPRMLRCGFGLLSITKCQYTYLVCTCLFLFSTQIWSGFCAHSHSVWILAQMTERYYEIPRQEEKSFCSFLKRCLVFDGLVNKEFQIMLIFLFCIHTKIRPQRSFLHLLHWDNVKRRRRAVCMDFSLKSGNTLHYDFLPVFQEYS